MAGSKPKSARNLAGDIPTAGALAYDPPATPADPDAVWQAILQLQNTVNALIVLFNAHVHGGVTVGAGNSAVSTTLIDGTAQAAADLFTAS